MLILFVVIPKMDAESVDTLETLEELDVQVEQIAAMIEQLENSVDEEIYRAIEEQLNALEAEMESLRETVAELREQVQRDQERIEELEEQLRQCQETQRDAQARIEELEREQQQSQQQIAELQREVDRRVEPPPPGPSGAGGRLFGLDPAFAIVAEWTENVDVDIWLKNNATGEWCYYSQAERDFIRLLQDVRTQAEGAAQYELMYQEDVVPGQYELYIHMYTSSGRADVTGYATLYPFTPREQKIPFSAPGLTHSDSPLRGGGKRIGTISLTANSINLR